MLRTERLLLRPLDTGDVERLAEIADDIRIARNMTSAFPHPYTVDEARSFIESDPDGFAIEPVTPIPALGPGIVGVVGGAAAGPDDMSGVHRFGYWLTPDAWRHGIATEAAQAYLGHIINTAKPRRVEAGVYAWNPASGHVLEKLGFELEGRLHQRIIRFGDVTDELIYGLIPT